MHCKLWPCEFSTKKYAFCSVNFLRLFFTWETFQAKAVPVVLFVHSVQQQKFCSCRTFAKQLHNLIVSLKFPEILSTKEAVNAPANFVCVCLPDTVWPKKGWKRKNFRYDVFFLSTLSNQILLCSSAKDTGRTGNVHYQTI